MADPIATSPVDTTTQTVQQTTEVLDGNGNNVPSQTTSALADIFGKIESGMGRDEAIAEVNKPTREEKREERQIEKIIEKKEEAEISELEKKLQQTQDRKDGKEESEEPTRESLREKSKTPEKAPEKPPVDPDPVTEEELTVLQSDKPKTAKRISALLAKIKEADSRVATTAKERDEKAAKLAELETKLSTVKTSDPETEKKIQEQLDELTKYRRLYDLDNDPELKTKYDSRLSAIDASIPEILKKNAAGDGLLKVIADEGGWTKFANSNKVFNTGEGTTATAAEIAEGVLKALPVQDRNQIQVAQLERIQVERERKRFYEEQQAGAKEYFEKQTKAQRDAVKAQEDAINSTAQQIADWHKKIESESDWAKEKDVPSDATPEQKAEIEDDNKYNKQLKGLLNKALNGHKPLGEMLEIVHDSVRYYDERRKNVKLQKTLAAVQKELAEAKGNLDNFKKAGRTVVKSGSIAGNGGSSNQVQTPAQKRPASLEDAFDRIERGVPITSEEE